MRLKNFDAAYELVQYIPADNTDTEYNMFLGHLQALQKQQKKHCPILKKDLRSITKGGLRSVVPGMLMR